MATFPAIRIEGGLLGPDMLDQLLAAGLPGQKPADFGPDGRRNLTDEIAAIFADARALWQVFQHRLQRLSAEDLATGVTRDAWGIPFLGLLGYEPRYNPRALEADGLTYAISHRAGEPEDAPPLHIVGVQQELDRVATSGRPRLAPHSLVQEYLNRTDHLWGIVTNGLTLRLLRNSTFVRRQAYVEFDLTAIFEESRFQDFAALYRLLHRTRLPRGMADARDCLLEQYYAHAVEQGGRIREHLRDGVEECIKSLANGFLRHRANDELRRRISPACIGNERISDDRATARALARRNRDERSGEMDLFAWNPSDTLADYTRKSRMLDAIADDAPEDIRRKKQLFEQSHIDPAWLRQKNACDLWCAAFFQALKPDTPAITSGALADHLGGRPIDPRLLAQAWAWSIRQGFLHWPLEFPEVFADGGFDVILSNPPWERVNLQEQEFFAVHHARIANAPTKAARSRLIEELPQTNPELHRKFAEALRASAAASLVMRHSGRFPLTGRGDINTYAVFAELAASATKSTGRAGLILPRGIATDDTTKLFFSSMVRTGRLVELVGFENEEFIFPAVDHRVTFCTLTLGGGGKPVARSRIAFYIRRFSQLSEEHLFFSLEEQDFWLLNPNTGNCPIFRTQADAELTEAIYRREPVLWREAAAGQPEANPWRLSFKTLLHMANDSHHFRTAQELAADGYRREGNVFVSPYDRYLPLYEAKMLHQFDHQFSTYKGATEKQPNVGILPQPSAEQKRDPAFVVQPRYWVREEVVESAIPKYPEPLATALQVEHRPSIEYVLALWAAGFYLHRGDTQEAANLLHATLSSDLDRAAVRALGVGTDEDHAKRLAQDFPLTEGDVQAITEHLDALEPLARDLVERFSPKWFLGWRDICRATDERTLIASVAPKVPTGHTFPLVFCPGIQSQTLALLLANLNCLPADYVARQKVGGTHITYNLLKQFPIFPPDRSLKEVPFPALHSLLLLQAWLFPRVLELTYTANDLGRLAHDWGYDGPPFSWDDERRFEIRCELDAAFFHLYLPCDPDGSWRQAEGETLEQLGALKHHFPQPRDAVAYILDQFPIMRHKDEQAHGRYRTKGRILEIYDAMLAAQRRGQPYQTKLNPPPGSQ